MFSAMPSPVPTNASPEDRRRVLLRSDRLPGLPLAHDWLAGDARARALHHPQLHVASAVLRKFLKRLAETR